MDEAVRRSAKRQPHRVGAVAASTVPGELLLGGGVLLGWIVAILLGLAWFRRLASGGPTDGRRRAKAPERGVRPHGRRPDIGEPRPSMR